MKLQSTVATEPATEQITEPTIEQITEPATEHTTESTPEPTADPTIEVITEAATESNAEPATQSAIDNLRNGVLQDYSEAVDDRHDHGYATSAPLSPGTVLSRYAIQVSMTLM